MTLYLLFFQRGRWNGLMGELVEKRTDMVLSALKVSAERQKVADFTVPFLESGIAILVAKRTGIISPTAFLGRQFRAYKKFSAFKKSACLTFKKLTSGSARFRILQKFLCLLSDNFDATSWMMVGLVGINASAFSIFIFEWLSPAGHDRKVGAEYHVYYSCNI